VLKAPQVTISYIVLGIIILGSFFILPRPLPCINQVGNTAGTVTLTLTPTTLNLQPNIESTLTLSIAADTSHATAAQIELTYDAEKIGTPIITQGDFFTSSLGSTIVTNGKINFTYVAPTTSGGIGSVRLLPLKLPPIVGNSTRVY
jgi:hypothetical protein